MSAWVIISLIKGLFLASRPTVHLSFISPRLPPDGLHISSLRLPRLGCRRVEKLCIPSGGREGAGGRWVISEQQVCLPGSCVTHKYTQTTGKALCSLSRLPFQRNSRSRIEACPRSSLSIWWDGDTRKDPISVATRVQLHRKVSLCYSLTNIHHASAISTYTLIWEILRSCLYSCVGVGICTFPRSSCWCPWFPMRFLQDWDTISPFLVRRGGRILSEVSWKTPPDLVKKCAHPFSHDLCKNIYSVNPFPLSTQLAQSNAD